MAILEAIWGGLQWFHGVRVILLAVPLTLILYFAFGKTAELSRHAMQNTSATVVFGLFNYLAALLFFKEINGFLQSVYAALQIPTLPADTWDAWPVLLVSLLGIVVKDFADYWNHRAMHTRWLWPTHAAHHTDTHVNAFTTYRVHVLETVVMSLSYIILLTWMQMPSAIPVVATISVIHNMYVHMDLDWDHGRFKFLLASPVFHRWHHADVKLAYGKNLANVIPLWDRLFGTYIEPGICREQMGAVKNGLSDKNPVLIWIYPFQEWARLVKQALRKQRTPDPVVTPVVTPAE